MYRQATEILKKLSLREKVGLMSGHTSRNSIHGALKGTTGVHYNEYPYSAGGNPEKGIPAVEFCDGPNGVVCGRGKSTCFPVPMMRAASFDTELEEKIGAAIGEEILAYGGNLFGGVCINLPYHPGWGRCQETYGEDDFLIGEMGKAMVRGVQSTGVIACLKHFAFNQMENNRFRVNVVCDKKTEREIFLRHFEKCVKAGAGAVMSAYNSYQGVMCGHNSYLLNDVLKKEWGFDGFVLSDFTWGVRDTIEAANGGQNIEMADTLYFGSRLVQAVLEGKVSESVIDDAALRIIHTMLRFDNIRREAFKGLKKQNRISTAGMIKKSVIGCKSHRQLALRSAEEGCVLLKNEGPVLPISRNNRKIAVFGRLADTPNTGDRGSARVYPEYTVTIIQGILKEVSEDAEVIYYTGKNLSHTKRLMKEADAAIIVAGYDYYDEGEAISRDQSTPEKGSFAGGDRCGLLRLHENDEEFLEKTAGLNPNTIVVLIAGSMIIPGKWIEKVPSVLYGFYGGMEGGHAIARVLFGKSDPGGRLPFVIPEKEEDLPKLDFSANEVRYQYWHGYRRLKHLGKKAMFPFGYGLSYTTFKLSGVEAEFDRERLKIRISANIQNTGKRTGETILQVYVKTPENDSVFCIKGFKRVKLEKDEEKEVQIEIEKFDLEIWNVEGGFFHLLPGKYNIGVGFSSDEKQWNILECLV